MSIVLEVDDLRVESHEGPLVRGVSFRLEPGEPLTLLGESGSGKTLVAQVIMGTLPAELRATGRVVFDGRELPQHDRRRLWGRRLALLPQEPWLALDPTMRARTQVAEVHRRVRGLRHRSARTATLDTLRGLDLDSAAERFPFQLSGGMCQRVALAVIRAGDADLLLADEPTKGLDSGLRDRVVAHLGEELRRGRSLLTITHDVAVARRLGGRVAVMLDGRMVESGPATRVLDHPRHDYTRRLVAADPATWPVRHARTRTGAEPVIAGEGLSKAYGPTALFSGLDLAAAGGEILAVVGPSGCGKTTLGNVLLGLIRPDGGTVRRRMGVAAVRYQKLYQDPPAAFAPQQTLHSAFNDLVRHHRLSQERGTAVLKRLRLTGNLLERRPAQLSGGELQRFALARVLLLEPLFLFADEATSRLDPIIQQEVIALLTELVDERGLALLLVTHDRVLAERVAGRVVELG